MTKYINVFDDKEAAKAFTDNPIQVLTLEKKMFVDEDGEDVYAILPIKYKEVKAITIIELNDKANKGKRKKKSSDDDVLSVEDFSDRQIAICNAAFVELTVTDSLAGTEDISKGKISINDFTIDQLNLIMAAIAPGLREISDDFRKKVESAISSYGGDVRKTPTRNSKSSVEDIQI